MIHPSEQWALQIICSDVCQRRCANCTRSLSHVRKHFSLSVDQFSHIVACVRDFLTDSKPNAAAKQKALILMGGEVLFHPEFRDLCEELHRQVPAKEHCGLWTGINWTKTDYRDIIDATFGLFNVNLHSSPSLHTPVLLAIRDVVSDEEEMWRCIDNCWLQARWCSAASVNGFWFCEVASGLDMAMGGPGGLPIAPGVWKRPREDFEYQRQWACPRCGVSLNLAGRQDPEEVDDISLGNLEALADSPRIKAGRYVLHETRPTAETAKPWKYIQ